MEGLREYVEMMHGRALMLWGMEEADKILGHIEDTATAVYRNAETWIPVSIEPATRLSHREKT